MRINTNVSSITAQEAAVNTNNNIKSSLEKLSTGLRINKASDDASGLAIADKLRTQATSINQGVSNGNSAVTLLQIADKSMAEQSNILDTVKAKLIQANTDTTSADGRESIRKDIAKLLEQLDNIAEQTNYNGNVLLQQSATDQSGSQDLSFQIGETSADLISNTAIRSNTQGLGSADAEVTTVTLEALDNTTYSITIGSGSTDASGNAITAQTVTFTTSGSATVSGIHAGLLGQLSGNTLVTADAYDSAASGSLVINAIDNNTALNISVTALGTDATASGIILATTTTGVDAVTAYSAEFTGTKLSVDGTGGGSLTFNIGGSDYTLAVASASSSGLELASGFTVTGVATALNSAIATGYVATGVGGVLTISETTGNFDLANTSMTLSVLSSGSATASGVTGYDNSGTSGILPTNASATATINAAGSGTNTYTLTVATGATVTFEATSGMTAAQIQDGLIAAATASGGIAASGGAYTIASGSSGGELIITATTTGAAGAFTATGEYAASTNIAESVTTAAGTGEALASLKDLAVNGLTKELASSYQAVVDDAITDLNGYRGDIGSTQNQVESAVRNLMTQATNVKAAESIIRDVDYAAESANFNKQNIISQAGSYAISQANSVQQNVLRLLQ